METTTYSPRDPTFLRRSAANHWVPPGAQTAVVHESVSKQHASLTFTGDTRHRYDVIPRDQACDMNTDLMIICGPVSPSSTSHSINGCCHGAAFDHYFKFASTTILGTTTCDVALKAQPSRFSGLRTSNSKPHTTSQAANHAKTLLVNLKMYSTYAAAATARGVAAALQAVDTGMTKPCKADHDEVLLASFRGYK